MPQRQVPVAEQQPHLSSDMSALLCCVQHVCTQKHQYDTILYISRTEPSFFPLHYMCSNNGYEDILPGSPALEDQVMVEGDAVLSFCISLSLETAR